MKSPAPLTITLTLAFAVLCGVAAYLSSLKSGNSTLVTVAPDSSSSVALRRKLTSLSYRGNNGIPSSAFPLGLCKGDCDSDRDCQSGLVCYQRNAGQSVPGCSGSDNNSNADYCIHPTSSSGGGTTSSGGTSSGLKFGLKIYWQKGYYWQEETIERKWCMRCDSSSQACSPGRKVYVTNCDTDMITKWEFKYLNSKAFQIKIAASNLCLTVQSDINKYLIADTCNSNNVRQQFYAQNGQAKFGSHFEINPVWAPDGCVGNTHHPKYGETLYVWKCEVSRAATTSNWNFY
jgi:hypothetical protein